MNLSIFDRVSSTLILAILLATALARADSGFPADPPWGTSLEQIQKLLPGGETSQRSGNKFYARVVRKKGKPTALYSYAVAPRIGLFAKTVMYLYEDAVVDLKSAKYELMDLEQARKQAALMRPVVVKNYGPPNSVSGDLEVWSLRGGDKMSFGIQRDGDAEATVVWTWVSSQGAGLRL